MSLAPIRRSDEFLFDGDTFVSASISPAPQLRIWGEPIPGTVQDPSHWNVDAASGVAGPDNAPAFPFRASPDVTRAAPDSAPTFPFRAVQDIVIIEQLVKDVSAGGIALVDDGRKYPCGRIVAHGPGRTYAFYMDANGTTQAGQTVPMQVKVGDWVVFGRYNSGGEPIECGGKKYLMCREGDIGLVALSGEPEVKLCPNPTA